MSRAWAVGVLAIWLPLGSSARAAPVTLQVPLVHDPVRLDGELGERFWSKQSARTGAFVDASGRPARPFTEVRLAWDGKALRLGLYAADREIVTGDRFRLRLGEGPTARTVFLGPTGHVAGASTALDARLAASMNATRLGHDVDGTVDDARDDDEEWVLEVALPLAALGVAPRPGSRLSVEIVREDVGAAAGGVVGRSAWAVPSGRGVFRLGPAPGP